MESIYQQNDAINQAHEIYQQFNADAELRELALAHEKYERDLATALYEAERRGVEQGVEQGKDAGLKEGKRAQAMETASRLLAMGMSADQIATATGLSGDEVRRRCE